MNNNMPFTKTKPSPDGQVWGGHYYEVTKHENYYIYRD